MEDVVDELIRIRYFTLFSILGLGKHFPSYKLFSLIDSIIHLTRELTIENC